ncbi:RHS repeat-associated core domain-containing protein [Streptomyces scopuliridis]|uniref:RHS repeat-associated core domain-containing protein n=1 Tax=Streptomyces scopuliridis TaxID=452529 RepID=UPI00368619C7
MNGPAETTASTARGGAAWHYRYDPLGRRTAKYRQDETGSVIDETRFTWDHEGYEPLEPARTQAPPGGDRLPILRHRHRPRRHPDRTRRRDRHHRLATLTTVWGTTAVHPGSAAHTSLRFSGQYADPETGFHYNYFRHYDPETARYTSPDPLGLEPAPNPVTYVHNPPTWVDPEGRKPGTCPRTGAAINPRGYTAVYEMQLNRTDFGQSRSVHFNRANAALDASIQADPALGRFLDQLSPEIATRVSSVGGRRTPAGFTWQHEPTSNAQGREGVMRLVPRYQHTSLSPWWDVLHPGYSGGC